MPALSLCFQVHQPYRLRQFSFFDIGRSTEYFDIDETKNVMQIVAKDVYRPAITAIERIQAKWGEDFRCSFYISGTAIEQMQEFAPLALESFSQLARNPSVELLGGTYYHSLASLLDNPEEFATQSRLHREVLLKEFGATPVVFFNAALRHSDPLAERIEQLGYSGILFEEFVDATGKQGSELLHRGSTSDVSILRCGFSVADGAFYEKGSIKEKRGWTPAVLMKKLQASVGKNGVVCVLADWSACNVRSGASSAVSWLEQVVETVLSTPGWRFVTPSQAFEEGQLLKGLFSQDPHGVEDLGGYTSELLGNSMQRKAFDELYSAPPMSQCDTVTWRRLQAVDHFRNMSTCGAQDSLVGGIRKLFESPYDAFITYMNVSRSVRHEASSAVHSRASTQK